MNLGLAIKELRKHKKYSQAELSAMVGVSQGSISQIELGEKRPSSSNTKKICKALGVSEPLLYILAIESTDIPKENKEKYELLFPAVQSLIKQLID